MKRFIQVIADFLVWIGARWAMTGLSKFIIWIATFLNATEVAEILSNAQWVFEGIAVGLTLVFAEYTEWALKK